MLIPYIDEVRREDNLASTQPALVIFDHFKGQITDKVFSVLEKHNILAVTVPANCTDRLQPMDLSVNKSIKDTLQASFQLWYAGEVKRHIDSNEHLEKPIDLKLSRMKPLGTQWFVNAFYHVQNNPEIVRNGFRAAGNFQQQLFH